MTEKTEGLIDQAKQAAGKVAGHTGEQLGNKLSQGKEKAAEKIGDVASALRDTSRAIPDVGPLPDLAERAADAVDRVSNYLRTRTFADLLGEVERFAKREPAMFLSGAFALGLLGGRFLKSSAPTRSDAFQGEYGDDQYGTTSGYDGFDNPNGHW